MNIVKFIGKSPLTAIVYFFSLRLVGKRKMFLLFTQIWASSPRSDFLFPPERE